MGEKKKISREAFHNIHAESSLPTPAFRLGLVTCFQNIEYGKQRIIISQWRNPAYTT